MVMASLSVSNCMTQFAGSSDYKNREQISPYRLAKWCRDHAGKVVGEYKLIRCGAHHAGFQNWQVMFVGQQQAAMEEQVIREF